MYVKFKTIQIISSSEHSKKKPYVKVTSVHLKPTASVLDR